MGEIFFCPNCMSKVANDNGVCPNCGCDLQIQNAPHQLPVNSILNARYLVGKTLGAGGFGITYVGYDLKFNNKVAIKEYFLSGGVNRSRSLTVIPTDQAAAEPFSKGKERFLGEAKVLAQFIDEPNIVKVRDYFEENGTAYIVMEFLDGEDLTHYAKRRGNLSYDETLSLLEPAMLALGRVHKKGLIHRDISPSNIMLLKDGNVKVLDFGTARTQSVLGEKSLSIMLKPGYAPEEQYRTHGKQGPWTDVYAMSATFYRLLTGKTPPTSTDRMFQDSIELPSALGVKISPQLEKALMRGLAVHSADRIQTMEELAECLAGKRKVRAAKKHLPWRKIAAAGIALILVSGAAYAAIRGINAKNSTAVTQSTESSTASVNSKPKGEYVLEERYECVKEIRTDTDGDQTVYEWEYNDYGNRTKYTHTFSYTYSSVTDTYWSESTYKYDEDQNMIYECYLHSNYSSNGSSEENQETEETYYEYEFDEDGDYSKRYEYDADHNLKGWTEYVYEKIEGSDRYRTTRYNYYPDGGLESYNVSYYDENEDYYYETYDSDGTLNYKSVYKYDSDGNWISYQSYSGDRLSSEESYTYDSEGRKISGKGVIYNDAGEIYSESTITYEYELMQIYVWHDFDE